MLKDLHRGDPFNVNSYWLDGIPAVFTHARDILRMRARIYIVRNGKSKKIFVFLFVF